MSNSFTREDLANHGKTQAEEKPEVEEEAAEAEVEEAEDLAEELDEETAEGIERERAERTTREVEHESDDAVPDLADYAAPDAPMPDMTDEDVAFNHDKYKAKMARWMTEQTTRAAREAVRGKSMQSHVESSITAFAKSHPDWMKTVAHNEKLANNQLHELAGQAVARSKHVAEILYHFGKNPDYAVAVSKMSPAQQLLEIGKIVGKIKAEKGSAAAAAKTTRESSGQRPTLTRKGPVTREQQLSGKSSMDEFARQSRADKKQRRPSYFK